MIAGQLQTAHIAEQPVCYRCRKQKQHVSFHIIFFLSIHYSSETLKSLFKFLDVGVQKNQFAHQEPESGDQIQTSGRLIYAKVLFSTKLHFLFPV